MVGRRRFWFENKHELMPSGNSKLAKTSEKLLFGYFFTKKIKIMKNIVTSVQQNMQKK